MGLDMYLCRIKKITSHDVTVLNNKIGSYIEEKGFHYYTAEDLQENNDLISEIRPYMTPVSAFVRMVDFGRFLRDHNIPEDSRIIGFSSTQEGNEFRFNGGETVKISSEEYEEYSYYKLETIYVFRKEDIAYWRKDYGLQNLVYELVNADNCKYCVLNDEQIDKIAEYSGKDLCKPESEDEAVVYWEWY